MGKKTLSIQKLSSGVTANELQILIWFLVCMHYPMTSLLTDVLGSVDNVPWTFTQAGVVQLFNLSDGAHLITTFSGDRRSSNFGGKVMVCCKIYI